MRMLFFLDILSGMCYHLIGKLVSRAGTRGDSLRETQRDFFHKKEVKQSGKQKEDD